VSRIGPTVYEAFSVAVSELGVLTAARLFVREVAEEGGAALVEELATTLGLEYAVLEAVARQWLAGARRAEADASAALAACTGASQLVIVGLEADCLDALVPKLQDTRAVLVRTPGVATDYERLTAGYGGRLETAELGALQRFAGRKSTLLTFLYGTRGDATWVDPLWMRVNGADVRTQFRALIGWEVLGAPMDLYPRWLVETTAAEFSHLVAG
jgi:hypothetical protein